MRLIVFALAAFIVSGPAAAQWKEYTYIVEGFAVAFPADPQIDETMHQIVAGGSVPAQVYSVRHNNGLFKMTVADARDSSLQEAPVIKEAVRQMTEGGELKIDIPARIYGHYGRQLSIAWPDGGLTTAAVFYSNERLYKLESTRFPGGSDHDLIRFQQSLTFDRNVRNRTAEQLSAYRAACTRGVGGNDPPGNPSGLDDPRCATD